MLVFPTAFGMISEKINLHSLHIHLTQASSAGQKPTHFSTGSLQGSPQGAEY